LGVKPKRKVTQMSDDPRIDRLAMWLEGEFDPEVYGSPTLGYMRGEDWRRLAVSALKFMDRCERDAEEVIDKAYSVKWPKRPVKRHWKEAE
jgi:hypothetical protein